MLGAKLVNSKTKNATRMIQKQQRFLGNKTEHGCFFFSIRFFFTFFAVALNFQTAGEGMDLNDGLFSQNGCCGYILKPPFMRDEKRFNPEMPQNLDGYCPISLTVQVPGQKRCFTDQQKKVIY